MKAKDIVKSVAKKTDLTAAKTGSDPRDPWSATGAGGGIAIPENVTSRRANILSKYYKSKGWNVDYISKNKKVAQSKKGDYEKWKRDHGIYEDEQQNIDELFGLKKKPEPKKPKISTADMRKYFEKEKSVTLQRHEPSIGNKKIQGVHVRQVHEDEVNEDLTTKISHPEIRSTIAQSPTLKRKKQLDKARARYEVPAPAGTMKHTMKKEENLDEVSLGDYKEKAKSQMKELKPHTKGEYGDIVKRVMKRREKGLAMATKREEVEVNEVSSELLGRYKEKAKKSADELTATGQHKKSTDRWMNVMKATGKQMDKTTANIKKVLRKEDNFGDPKAASEAPFDMGNTPNQVAPKKMSKAASMVKEIYKRKLKEDMYDWEKDQKDARPSGKKPSMQKVDGSNELGDKKPKARMVLKGGTTLTGEKRDTVEIDPMLKNRTAMPDYKDMDKKQKPQEQ